MIVKRSVKGARMVSIVKDPSYPFNVGYAVGEVEKGTVVEINDDRVVYDWRGKTYYPVITPNGVRGFINTEAIEEVPKNGRRRDNSND